MQGGKTVGIAGFGGLGQMGNLSVIPIKSRWSRPKTTRIVQVTINQEPEEMQFILRVLDHFILLGLLLAKAMGNSVSIISSSPKKEGMAKALGADKFIVSKDPDAMKQAVKSLDLILDTISASHDIQPNLELLKKKGTYVVLGLCFQPLQVRFIKLLLDQVKITGSSVGGMKITQECINFVAEKNLQVETKMLTSIAQVSEAEKALQQGNDSGVRYVIDMQKALS